MRAPASLIAEPLAPSGAFTARLRRSHTSPLEIRRAGPRKWRADNDSGSELSLSAHELHAQTAGAGLVEFRLQNGPRVHLLLSARLEARSL